MKAQSTVRIVTFITLLGMLMLTSGCMVTSALWPKHSCEPAKPPNVSLYQSTEAKDILVLYDEKMGEALDSHRHAYWLFAYQKQLTARKTRPTTSRHAKPPAKQASQPSVMCKPKFIPPGATNEMNRVAFIKHTTTTNAPSATEWFAIQAEDPNQFRLFREGREIGEYKLPVYQEGPPPKAWRIALTPLAVAADVAIVAVMIVGPLAGASAGVGPIGVQ